jgi:hypothetical protein
MSQIPEPADKPGQRHDLLRRFSNPWVGVLGTVFTIVGVGLAIYFYFGGARTRRLTYSVNPVKTIVVKAGEASTLRVLHGDQEIKGDITAAQVAIWNDGTESIRPENVLSPVRILLHPPVPILEAKIRKVSREVIGAALDTSRLSDGVVPVTWKILEHNDGAVIPLIFAGPTETDIAVEGTVEGQPTVSRLGPPAEETAGARWFRLVVAPVFWFVVAGVLFWLQRLERRRGDQLDLIDRIVPWGVALGRACGLWDHGWSCANPGRPSASDRPRCKPCASSFARPQGPGTQNDSGTHKRCPYRSAVRPSLFFPADCRALTVCSENGRLTDRRAEASPRPYIRNGNHSHGFWVPASRRA